MPTNPIHLLRTLAPFLFVLLAGCADSSGDATEQYLSTLEQNNGIRYRGIENTPGAYITPMCYTRVMDEDGTLHNPCYSCHTRPKEPNYFNDASLQKEYSFPRKMLENPYSNLFQDRSAKVAEISDDEILDYVRTSNYLDDEGQILLADRLPETWKGYRPDSYFDFDEEGFDRAPDGGYSLWRAFRYYPFLGTFWPTNGSMDDVLIRLPVHFAQDESGQLDIEIYRINLAIVESLIKQKNIALPQPVDEATLQVDFDQDGQRSSAQQVVYNPDQMSYVGMARVLLKTGKIHLAGGLFPVGTEFLHSVRYIDWDESAEEPQISPRMKELRYARKYAWRNYSELERLARAELYEAEINDFTQGQLASFRGNFEDGMNNEMGWIYQGFIEDRSGDLRPQTQEETLYCMGCHAHLGATTDSTFAFARKFEAVDASDLLVGWGHWSGKGLKSVPEPRVEYLGLGEQFEYSFYLQNNHSGNEFRNNDEVQNRFFDAEGQVRPGQIQALHEDISLLLYPSRTRALALDKAYRVLVESQSLIFGREANVHPMENVLQRVGEGATTGIEQVIVPEN